MFLHRKEKNTGHHFNTELIPGIVEIERKKYAVNLLWNTVHINDDFIKSLKASAKSLDSKLYCKMDTLGGRQYAIADKRIGHKVGLETLLSKVNINEGSVCAACTPDGNIWIMFAIDRDGIVYADKCSINNDDVISNFNNILYLREWDRIYCPSEWGVANSSEVDFSELFSGKGKRIKALGARRYVPVILLIPIAFIIFDVVKSYITKNETDINVIATVEQMPPDEQPVMELDYPWGGKIKPESFLTQCISSIGKRLFDISKVPGWEIGQNIICTEKGISFSLEKRDGLLLWFDASTKSFNDNPSTSFVSDNQATVAWSFDGLIYYEKGKLDPKNLLKASDIEKFLKNSFEQSFTEIDIELNETTNLKDNISKIFTGNFTFTTHADPVMFLAILNQVYGLCLEQILYDYGASTWRVEGRFWGR
ncbi:hypothetical protein ACOMQ0_004565 [Enterobacter quasiroggenkampii]|uniref:hypothetical protein n=1 Tax=Enterobacter sp. HK-058-C-ECC TaxID=3397227 RepID=UPI0039DFE6C8